MSARSRSSAAALALVLAGFTTAGCDDDGPVGAEVEDARGGTADGGDGGRTDARTDGGAPFDSGCCIDDGSTPGPDAGGDGGLDGGSDAAVDAGPPRTRPRFVLAGGGFYDTPWPADARLSAAGTPDLTGFAGNSPTFVRLAAEVQAHVHGYANMPVVFVAFDDAIHTLPLPDAAASRLPESPVQLLALGADCGTRLPIDVAVRVTGDRFIPANTLQVKNAIGTVLSPGVAYAVVVLRDFGASENRPAEPSADFAAVWAGDDSVWSSSLDPLRQCLPTLGLDPARVAVATVFTPQDPVDELRRIHALALDPEQTPSRPLTAFGRDEAWTRKRLRIRTFSGLLPMPVFQDGTPPYSSEGGNFVFAPDGTPQVQRWEDVPVAAAWRTFDTPPEGPRPVLVFIDGTGWDRWGHLSGSWMRTVLDAGFVVFSFMPQFHGGRAGTTGSPELPSFNFLNPPAGRSNFRQQAVETSYFARAIREQLNEIEGLPPIEPTLIVYGGHSQGALVGAINAAVSHEFAGYLLNGLSSYLSLTILNRKDLLNFEAVVRGLLGNPGPLDTFAPALSFMQLGGEAVDPHNFARLWRGTPADPRGNHVFVINGFADDTTTPRGMDHLTLSAGLPIFDPPGWNVDPQNLHSEGLPLVALPQSGNVLSVAGTPLTQGTYLDPVADHFTIHRSGLLQQMGVRFWQSALNEALPRLQPDAELMCADGGDDDQDEAIDCADSDCAAREPCVETRCDDELDGDNDGLTDCADPDCVNAAACQEADCADGTDEDGDGLIDCADPGCAAREPCREVNCTDGLDGDADGAIDCADSDCRGQNICRETSCSDGNDNNRDGLVDCEDPQCLTSLACPEPSCTDGTDEDGNGLIDCADPRCNRDEACVIIVETDCANGEDDDADGAVDCADPDCAVACGPFDACADGDLGEAVGMAVFQGTLAGAENTWPPGDCTGLGTGEGTPDLALRFTAPVAGRYTFSTLGSATDTVLTLRDDVCTDAPRESGDERACSDDQPGVTTSAIVADLAAGRSIRLILSAYAPLTGPDQGGVVLNILRADP